MAGMVRQLRAELNAAGTSTGMRVVLVNNIFLSPRLWLAAAVLALGGSFVIDYVESQQTADRTLALRLGPPPLVAIQSFEAGRHIGPAREVRVVAEADIGTPLIVDLDTAGMPERAMIVPLFPLSDVGITAVRGRIDPLEGGAPVRPAPRPAAPAPPVDALGFIVHRIDNSARGGVAADRLASQFLGGGRYGSIVIVNGERVAAGDLALVVTGAMAADGSGLAEDFVAIAPYVNGRQAALSPPPSTGLQSILFWSGFLLALGAIILSVRGDVDEAVRSGPAPVSETRRSTGTTPKARSRFQILPTQDELHIERDDDQSDTLPPGVMARLRAGFRSRR